MIDTLEASGGKEALTKDTTKDDGFKRYGLAVGLGGIVLGLIVLGIYVLRTSVWISPVPPQEPDLNSSNRLSPGSSDSGSQSTPDTIPSILPSISPATDPLDTPEQSSSAFPPDAIPQGRLRVSNQTMHPVRIALLAQGAVNSDAELSANQELTYDEPVHWDFAPEEGSAKGLLLSLPETDLRLQAGDILMAFAQDGSRRYWGPYVVGKTDLPRWHAETQEWRLILQP
jgi:hypothetical protein